MRINLLENHDNSVYPSIISSICSNTLPSILLDSNDATENHRKRVVQTLDISQTSCQQDKKMTLLIDFEYPKD